MSASLRAVVLALASFTAFVSRGDGASDVWGATTDEACSPEWPCVHLVAHTHLDPGWRVSFDRYHERFGVVIHPGVLSALARDPRRRFTLADAAFLVRWLEERGDHATPTDCVYAPNDDALSDHHRSTPRSDDPWRHPATLRESSARTAETAPATEPCPPTWLALARRLLADRRLDVVGGGWVSHDEANVPARLAAAQTDEGVRSLRDLLAPDRPAWRPTVAWQIDPFGHAAATPALLDHLGFRAVVINRVSRADRDDIIAHRARHFAWTSSETDDPASRGVRAHLLRRHYNLPETLDFDGAGKTPQTDAATRRAARTLAEVAAEAFEGTDATRGNAMLLVGDDFRFARAEETFEAWERVLDRVDETSASAVSSRAPTKVERAPRRATGTSAASPSPSPSPSRFRYRWSTPSEYFDAVAGRSPRGSAGLAGLPRRSGGFFPYADNVPSWENAWIGSYAARRRLKNAVSDAAEDVAEASTLVALVAAGVSSTRARGDVGARAAAAERAARDAARDAFLGLHHDAVTGTCPSDVAEDYVARCRRGALAARRAVAMAARVALECPEEENADAVARADDDRDDDRDVDDVDDEELVSPPALAREGDSVAVRNPSSRRVSRGWVRVRVAEGLVVVDERTGETLPAQRERRRQRVADADADVLSDARRSDRSGAPNLASIVAIVRDLPPLGLARLTARRANARAEEVDANYASVRDVSPADVGVDVRRDGIAVDGAWTSAAWSATPRDEHFGDGPYVSRSVYAHAAPLGLRLVAGYVATTCFLVAYRLALGTGSGSVTVIGTGTSGTGTSAPRRGRSLWSGHGHGHGHGHGRGVASRGVTFVGALRARFAAFANAARRIFRRRRGRVFAPRVDLATRPRPSARRGLRFPGLDLNRRRDGPAATFRRGCRAASVGVVVAAAFWSPAAVPADVHATLVVDGGVLGVFLGASFALAAAAASPTFPSVTASVTPMNAVVSAAVSSTVSSTFAVAGAATYHATFPAAQRRAMRLSAAEPPRCLAGAVYAECSARFTDGPYAAAVTVRVPSNAADGVRTEVTWTSLAPLDAEIFARVRSADGASFARLLVDDGVGVVTSRWSRRRISAPANTLPSGRFVVGVVDRAPSVGVAMTRGGTSVAHAGGALEMSVHRQALSDDGKGLGAHADGTAGKMNRHDLSDPRAGRLSFRVVPGVFRNGDGVEAIERTVRETAAASRERWPRATTVPRGCARTTWAGLPGEMPPGVRVVSASAAPPLGAPAEAKGACPVWLRLERGDVFGGEGGTDATDVERALGGRVVMRPERLEGGGLAYALWDRTRCEE